MSLVEQLYSNEDISLRDIWNNYPFGLFSPKIWFLGFGTIVEAINKQDPLFFVNNVGNNFFPDKKPNEVLDGIASAINKGVRALNDMCEFYLPEASGLLRIPEVNLPYDLLQAMTRAREKWITARSGKHKIPGKGKSIDYQLLLEAYKTVRNWGIGHFVLIIDEDPQVYHSISHLSAISKWFSEKFGFTNPRPYSADFYSWETASGVKVIGTKLYPFRQRAKVHDESGNVRYGSIFAKMFLKKGFLDRIHDTLGVELIVEDDESVSRMISYVRRQIRATGTLEKYDHKVREEPPAFRCDKFILRVPIRVKDSDYQTEKMESARPDCTTVRFPMEKIIRVPVEVQIRPIQEIDHNSYKKQEYMKVFPLWYPRELYEPILKVNA